MCNDKMCNDKLNAFSSSVADVLFFPFVFLLIYFVQGVYDVGFDVGKI